MKMFRNKMITSIAMVSTTAFLFISNCYAVNEVPKLHSATTIDRLAAATKHKILTENASSIAGEAAEIEQETHKAIVALGNKDAKGATTILQGVSTKLDNLIAKNPGLQLVPATVETDVFDFNGTNKDIANAIEETDDLLEHGRLQTARRVISLLASEIRITRTSVPLGTYPAAIKQIIPLIDSGKMDQAAVDLSSVLDTLVVSTDVMPLPVLRAEELLTAAAELEHRDDLSKEANRTEIHLFTDAAKLQLERAQLLGYGNKDDYKTLYQEIDAIHKTLFSEHSAAVWQKVKNDLGQFKDRLKALTEATERVGHPAK
jgi:hypothetical protein